MDSYGNSTKKTAAKGRGFSLKARILLMVLLPLIVFAVAVCSYGIVNIKSGMDDAAMEGLKGTAAGLAAALNAADQGDYAQDADGNVFKGKYKITGNYEIMDSIKKASSYDVTFFYGDTRVATSIVKTGTSDRIIGTQCTDTVKARVLEGGQTYESKKVLINGQNYYVCYMPLKNSDGSIAGMAFAGIPSSTMQSFFIKKVSGFIGMSIFIIVIGIIGTILTTRSLSSAINACQTYVWKMEQGDLTGVIEDKYKKRTDVIGHMARELERFGHKLADIVASIKQSSDTIFSSGTSLDDMAAQTSATSDEISKAVEDISKGAVSQAEEIETASKNVGTMGDVIEQITDRVGQLDRTSNDMKTASDESTRIIQELSASNDRTTEAVKRISDQIKTTYDSVQTIRQAVDLITSIADETSLLSLNASIEAARAGEHGRGFAVVASEIQKLADQSSNSAKQIEDVIETLLKESENTVKVMEEVDQIVGEQQQKLEETKNKFIDVTDGVDSSRAETSVIKEDTESCNSARSKVVDVISNLSAISEENAASTQETTASMQELNATINILAESAKKLKDLSMNLQKAVEFFKI